MIYKTKYDVTIRKWIKTMTGYRTAELIGIEWRQLSSLFPPDGRLKTFDGQVIQRNLNRSRANKFADYLFDRLVNEKRFTIPPVVLTILPRKDEDWNVDVPIPFNHSNVGEPEVLPAGTIIVVNDGQHRIEGLRTLMSRMRDKKWTEKQNLDKAMIKKINAMYDTSSELCAQVHTVFFAEEMQQMFSDINSTASKPSKSITLFFDKANDFNASIASLIEKSDVLRDRTDVQKTVCSGKSSNVFTVATVTAAVRAFYPEKGKKEGLTEDELELMIKVFDKNAWLWKTDDRTAESLRAESLAPHSVFIQGLMKFMRTFIAGKGDNWETYTFPVPWQRMNNPTMLHRCVTSDGRILAGERHADLVSAALKKESRFSLNLSEDRAELELNAELQTIADMEKAKK